MYYRSIEKKCDRTGKNVAQGIAAVELFCQVAQQ